MKYLYLSENMILEIEKEAFDGQTSLEVLDLSSNVLKTIPETIFHLPSLTRLYLSQNEHTNVVEEIEKNNEITSPLVYFDISYNNLLTLPNLGVLRTLVKYNISGNDGIKLKIQDFAGICNLNILVNDKLTATFDDECDCVNTERWFKERSVIFTSFKCTAKGKKIYIHFD